jgi:nitrous oxidase accessory protein NosD
VSFTLRGRLETRLAAVLVPFLAACVLSLALREWWPLELAAVMVGVGLALDAIVYHRLLAYQPGWVALPLGLLELGLTMLLVRRLELDAPLAPAVWFFAASWIVGQVVVHAVLPLVRLPYADDGGELGRPGLVLSAGAPAALVAVLGVAWVSQPPVVRLEAGVHEGPLVLDEAQTLVGEQGAVVRGGIRVEADDVTIRNVTVFGGEIGIEVRDSEDVVLDDVRIGGTTMDGINARRSSLTIRDCEIDMPTVVGTQGIDISFAVTQPPSLVERCDVRGGSEGIVSHLARVMFRENRVAGTKLRGIAVAEMSMGLVEQNVVQDAVGVGIFCGDYSRCEIRENSVAGTRADPSGNPTRAGHGIVAHYWAIAELDDNQLDRGAAAFIHAQLADIQHP